MWMHTFHVMPYMHTRHMIHSALIITLPARSKHTRKRHMEYLKIKSDEISKVLRLGLREVVNQSIIRHGEVLLATRILARKVCEHDTVRIRVNPNRVFAI